MEEATIARDYTWPVKITTFDAGQDQRLTPAGQLRLQQEIGELHMSTGGLGYQVLCDAGMAFLLTRTNSVVHRAPALNEEAVSYTHLRRGGAHSGFRRRLGRGRNRTGISRSAAGQRPRQTKSGQYRKNSLVHGPKILSVNRPQYRRFRTPARRRCV